MEEFSYWHIDYLTCEGNIRWNTARAPGEWVEYDITDRVSMVDDIAELISIHEILSIAEIDIGWDFTD